MSARDDLMNAYVTRDEFSFLEKGVGSVRDATGYGPTTSMSVGTAAAALRKCQQSVLSRDADLIAAD